MKKHLIGFLICAIAFSASVGAMNIFSLEHNAEIVRRVNTPAVSVAVEEKINNSLLEDEQTASKNEVQKTLLLNLAVQTCKTFWTHINKEEFAGIGFIEVILTPETPAVSAHWTVRMQLIPKNGADYSGEAPVFTSDSFPGNERLAWNIEEEPGRSAGDGQNRKLFVFKKTGQTFREIRPNVFRAE